MRSLETWAPCSIHLEAFARSLEGLEARTISYQAPADNRDANNVTAYPISIAKQTEPCYL